MTNQNVSAEKALSIYRKRWLIEELFRKLKTSGFHWENTHMTAPDRLVTLLIILSFGLLMSYLVGLKTKIPWKKTLNSQLYSVFKRGLIQLQFCLARGLEMTLVILGKCFKTIHQSLFSKSDP